MAIERDCIVAACRDKETLRKGSRFALWPCGCLLICMEALRDKLQVRSSKKLGTAEYATGVEGCNQDCCASETSLRDQTIEWHLNGRYHDDGKANEAVRCMTATHVALWEVRRARDAHVHTFAGHDVHNLMSDRSSLYVSYNVLQSAELMHLHTMHIATLVPSATPIA